jgi:outer membrane biosynthesis protein TonB
MVRKKSNDSAGAVGFLLLAALATLITLASAFYGIVLLVAWNFYARKSSRIQTVNSVGYFMPTRQESRQIAELEKAVADARSELKSLQSQGQGLSLRSDGEYDERSSVGKRLNRETGAAFSEERSLVLELDEVRNYRYARLNRYLEIKVGAASWKRAGIAYVIAIPFFFIARPDWVVGLSEFLNKSGWLGTFKAIPLLWGVLAAAAFVSLIVQQAIRLYSRHAIQRALEKGEKPARHAAIRFTEMLANELDIGLCEAADLETAKAIFKEREATENQTPAPSPTLTVEVKPEPVVPKVAEQFKPKVNEVPRPKRAFLKPLLLTAGFSLAGLVTAALYFGATGQESQLAGKPKEIAVNVSESSNSVPSASSSTTAVSSANATPTEADKSNIERRTLMASKLQSFECNDYCLLQYLDTAGNSQTALCVDAEQCKAWAKEPKSFAALVGTQAELIVEKKFVPEGNTTVDSIVAINAANSAALATSTSTSVPTASIAGSFGNTLCKSGEATAFACSTGKKDVALCATGNAQSGGVQMAYRIAPSGQASPEMVYPEQPTAARLIFKGGSQSLTGDKSMAFVSFDKGAYRYVIYSAEGKALDKAGVAVEQEGKRIANLACATAVIGDWSAVTSAALPADTRAFNLP